MSLLDTINAAREEAREGGSLPTRGADKQAKEAASVNRSGKKKSAASAKPAREAASSVRVVESAEKRANDLSLSKEERKEAKRAQREETDMRAQAVQIMLDHDAEYKRTEKVWWVVLAVGFLSTAAGLASYYLAPAGVNADGTAAPSILAIVCIVIAYACIIGSFAYDWFKRRPIRRATEAKAATLTTRKLQSIFEQERKERAAKKAEKEARKAARTSGK